MTQMKRWLGCLLAVYALGFLVMAVIHAGIAIPIGVATLRDVPIRGAVPFEALCGVVLGWAAAAALGGAARAWAAAQTAMGISLFFVMIGLYFTAFGTGGSSLNTAFHIVIGVLLVVSIGGLFLPAVRGAVDAAA
jgi:hypothetical protein